MEKPLKFINIDGKSRPLDSNKKYLVNKIFQEVEELWIGLGTQKIRRTIKKYLDGIR
jgi:nicotinamide mononucleotide adenylyltransferase